MEAMREESQMGGWGVDGQTLGEDITSLLIFFIFHRLWRRCNVHDHKSGFPTRRAGLMDCCYAAVVMVRTAD